MEHDQTQEEGAEKPSFVVVDMLMEEYSVPLIYKGEDEDDIEDLPFSIEEIYDCEAPTDVVENINGLSLRYLLTLAKCKGTIEKSPYH